MNRGVFPPIAKACLIGFAASFFYLAVFEPLKILEIPKLKVLDFFFTVRRLVVPASPVLNEIILVTMDDESIEKIHEGQPFPRRIYAEAIDRLASYDAKLIAFDMIFSGRSNPADDFLLAQSIQKSGNVILSSFVDQERNYVWPFHEFRAAAKASGVVNKLLDRDLHVRKSNLFYLDEKGALLAWSWEIEIARALLGFDLTDHKILNSGIDFKSYFLPFYEKKEVMINYRFDLKNVNRISLWQLLENKTLAERFRGKTVLIGATSRLLHDYYNTPFGFMPGVIVNMNLLANILNRDFLKKIPFFINMSFLFLFVSLASYIGFRVYILRGLALFLLASAACLGSFFVLFLRNLIGDYFSPIAFGTIIFIAVAFYRFFHAMVENIQLRGKVITDPLTGLYNRRLLESRIESELEELANARGGRKTDPLHELSILMIDIDNFKRINDTYGHQFGDDVLKNIAFSIKENIRKNDIAARFGGEEFCIVLPHATKEEARQIAEKIRLTVQAKRFSYVNQVASFTVSIGIASAQEDQLLASRSLIRAADETLYQAKREGKNRVCLYNR